MILQACSFNGNRSAPHLNFEALAEAVKLLSANQVRVYCADFAETIALGFGECWDSDARGLR